MKELLSGDQAVARGAYECGVTFGAGYPGTPSTEILEAFKKFPGVKAQWAPNEKVALEVAVGASVGGARALATMKHVGLNVAADPLFSAAYSGVNGGLVIVSADDPGMHSSQNEQDNRHIARAAKIPMLEPSDSQETLEFTKLGYVLSELYDVPVLLRMTTRVCHTMTVTNTSEVEKFKIKPYKKNYTKNVLLPSNARVRHAELEKSLAALEDYGNKAFDLNAIDVGSPEVGIITSGVAYQYAKEALPNASFLKLGMTFPLPKKLIKYFASMVKRLYVVEELEPYLETEIRAMGIEVKGKELFPIMGELNADIVAKGLALENAFQPESNNVKVDIPNRPPTLCPGCGHRGMMYIFHKLHLNVTGDIGCYTLGALPPLHAMDTCLCMGASVSMAFGLELAQGAETAKKTIAVIGDSTFMHSGITALINIVYNQGISTVCILDNKITAMTGHQGNPITGEMLQGEHEPQFDIVKMCEAVGVKNVRVVDPYNLEETEKIVVEELNRPEPSVIITKGPCVLHAKTVFGKPYEVIDDKCPKCGVCFQVGCSAIGVSDGKVVIDELMCIGCDICAQVCTFNAIVQMN